uniref:Uncharacterized protein n=1 Tax=Lotus japonicus TaxID=34305 RepID=I3T9P2_LOTJA|nr:unknown [Lotus japonicus]
MVDYKSSLPDCHMDTLWVQMESWRLYHSTLPTIPETQNNSIPHRARPMLHTFQQYQQCDLYRVRVMKYHYPTQVHHSQEGVCQGRCVCRRGDRCRNGGGERKLQIGERRRFHPRSLMLSSSIFLP